MRTLVWEDKQEGNLAQELWSVEGGETNAQMLANTLACACSFFFELLYVNSGKISLEEYMISQKYHEG
jgi:hypothetical protein